ncbi:hypothetical protein ACS25B_20180 [Dickeya dadantii subsp. dieffenbachiae]|uniref:hypothetical protein n=1 Tax=Dickeya dadantii TaxID=204038 RepID=UPI0003A6020B|nr:hypothetical protein [Dickeya dadantii]
MKRIVLAAAVSLVLSESASAKERTGGTTMPESVSSLSINDIESVSPALARYARYAREDVLADL